MSTQQVGNLYQRFALHLFRGHTYLAASILDINRKKKSHNWLSHYGVNCSKNNTGRIKLIHSTTAVVPVENADAYFAKDGTF